MTGLWPPGAVRTGRSPQGADARWQGEWVPTAGRHPCVSSPRTHTQRPRPRSTFRIFQKSAAAPRSAGRHRVPSPPKGSAARARLATSLLPASRRPRPGPPQSLTWPWRGSRAEDRGWPAPRPGLASPPPGRSRRCSPLAAAALLRGASAAGGWRLCGRRARLALSSPGRSEAAAAAAGGGFLRCCPSRFPRTSSAGTPAPPPPAPPFGPRQPRRPQGASGAPVPSARVAGARFPAAALEDAPIHTATPPPPALAPPFQTPRPRCAAPAGYGGWYVARPSPKEHCPPVRLMRAAKRKTIFSPIPPRSFSALASSRACFLCPQNDG